MYLLPIFSKIILFTDDTTLLNSCNNIHFLKYSLKHDMALLMDWYHANQLSLNVNKTVLVKFWPTATPFKIKIGDVELPNSKSTKFLGVMVDECLTWNDHVGKIHSKLNSNKMLLVTAKNLLPTSALRKLYFAHIYSHLSYSLVVWGSMMSKSSYNSLYKLQKDCVRLIAKAKGNSSAKPLFSDLKIIRLPDLIENELCKLGYRLDKKIFPIPIVDLFHRNSGKKTHKYDMRQKTLPNIQRQTTPLFNKSFLCKSLMLCGKLPTRIKHVTTLKGFCQNLKTLNN